MEGRFLSLGETAVVQASGLAPACRPGGFLRTLSSSAGRGWMLPCVPARKGGRRRPSSQGLEWPDGQESLSLPPRPCWLSPKQPAPCGGSPSSSQRCLDSQRASAARPDRGCVCECVCVITLESLPLWKCRSFRGGRRHSQRIEVTAAWEPA